VILILRFLSLFALLYNAWIIFRVVDEWVGLVAAIFSILLLPVSIIVMPILMFFIPSGAAGPLALWPAIALITFLEWSARKQSSTLLLR